MDVKVRILCMDKKCIIDKILTFLIDFILLFTVVAPEVRGDTNLPPGACIYISPPDS